MKRRVAIKVIYRWSRGLGNYTWNGYGTVIRAHRKLESCKARGRYHGTLPGLPYV